MNPSSNRGKGFRRWESCPNPIAIGGCLSLHWQVWSDEGAKPWVVEVLRWGYQIPFRRAPTLSKDPIPFPAYGPNSIRGKALEGEVQSLLTKGAIEIAPLLSPGFYSRLFVVMKVSGAWRPVIDLSILNLRIQQTSFKMETLQSVLLSVHPGDWMVSLDLKDAYLQVPMHPESRKFLRLMVGEKVYQFKALCFGLSTAPQVFTRIMAPVSAILHRMGVRLRRYLDDWLLQASLREQVLLSLRTVLRLCWSLGIVINWEKSQVIPTRQMVYLGVILNSTTFRASPALKRVEKLLSIGDVFLSCVSQPASSWLELLGVLSSMIQLVAGGRLRMRSQQLALRRQWDHVDQSQMVEWSQEVHRDLTWWLDRDRLELSISLEQVSPQLELWSDASDVGWGAHLDEQVASGLWAPEEVKLSINVRELLAIERALLWFAPHLVDSLVAIFADNSTTISYLGNQGGTHSSLLNSIAQRILRLAESLPVVISPQFIMGKHNVLANALSRPNQILGSEWTLKQEVFRDLCKRWPVSIDLFATSQNHRCSIYFFPYHDHNALGTDALLQNWNGWQAYAFPPWSLIPAGLKKLRSSSGVLLTIIAPYWPQRPWFPDLLDLVVDGLAALPQSGDLLRQPHFHRFHLGVSRLSLHAWRPSSDSPMPVDSPDM